MSNNESRDTCIYFMFKLATALKNRPVDRHHRWRIRLASGSKQAARATPTARSACFVPQSAYHGFTQQRPFTVVTKRASPKTLYINNIDIRGSVKTPDPRTFIYLSIRQLSATLVAWDRYIRESIGLIMNDSLESTSWDYDQENSHFIDCKPDFVHKYSQNRNFGELRSGNLQFYW